MRGGHTSNGFTCREHWEPKLVEQLLLLSTALASTCTKMSAVAASVTTTEITASTVTTVARPIRRTRQVLHSGLGRAFQLSFTNLLPGMGRSWLVHIR